jgi:hypothetical protein
MPQLQVVGAIYPQQVTLWVETMELVGGFRHFPIPILWDSKPPILGELPLSLKFSLGETDVPIPAG